MYMTDDVTNPTKFAFNLGTVAPGSFHLFWADSDELDGKNHTNFKLSKAGETLSLFDAEGVLVDQIVFSEQRADVSYGRSSDGADSLVYFEVPTPRASNSGTSRIASDRANDLLIYPNPSSGRFFIDNLGLYQTAVVYSLTGRVLKEIRIADRQIDLTDLASGLYNLVLVGDERSAKMRVVIIH